MIRPAKVLAQTLSLLVLIAVVGRSADDYKPGADSVAQPGVPTGEVLKFTLETSKIFPGTFHTYSVYIPAEYDGTKPACLYVCQDGVSNAAPVVFNNLIFRKEMPVTIGVFVAPGQVRALDSAHALNRFNRSYEYDGLGEAYARFLIEELLPDAESKHATDGRPIRLSRDPNDRAIAGQSSGGIAAFTAAWERPDSFHRVYSAIGTFVGLRGGDSYPILIRKTEPKPLRVFLQDGSGDQNIYGGDWWMANQTMERALVFSGYAVNHAWGDGGHTGKQSTMIFPDAMRWLWKDWPKAVEAGPSKNAMLNEILIPGEDWLLVGEGYKSTDGSTVSPTGEVFFADRPNNKTYRVGLDGKVNVFLADAHQVSGETFGTDGRLYAVSSPASQLLAFDEAGHSTVITDGLVHGNDLVMAHNGNMYVTSDPPLTDPTAPSKVVLIRPNGEKVVVDSGLKFANGIVLSPDQSLLYVDDSRSHWVYSYQIQPDGTLLDKQRYYWLHTRDVDDDTAADGMRVDRDGRLYVTTKMGIQVCDQAGRVNCILPTPNGKVSNLTFGGAHFDTIYAVCGDKVYKRHVKVTGANGWAEPNKPAAPHL